VAGENPPGGTVVYYSLKDRPKGDVTLEFLDASGKLVKKFSSREEARPAGPPAEGGEEGFFAPPPARLSAQQGMNRFVWNQRYPDATSFPGLIMWAGSVTGPRVAPGKYQVRLTVDGKSQTQAFEVMKDPRLTTTPEEYARQVSLALQIRDKLTETNDGVIRIREVRKQLEEYTKRDDKRVADAAKGLVAKMTAVEEELYQTKNRASEDPLNYPIKLNNKLAHLLMVVSGGDYAPTAQSNMVYEDLATRVNVQLKTLNSLMGSDLAAFNQLIHDANIPAVEAPKGGEGRP
jgi:hypothetical protein